MPESSHTQEFSFSPDLLSVWEEYRKAAKRSRQLRSLVNRNRLINLALVVGGAVLGVLASQLGEWSAAPQQLPDILAIGSAIALAVAAFLSRHVLDSEYEKQWVVSRSQAEALKSEAYVYLVQAPPYDGDDRDERLSEKAQDILGEAVHLTILLTEEEKRARLPDGWLSMNGYLKERVTDQISGFYEPKALGYQTVLQRLRRAGVALGLVGAALGAVSTVAAQTWPAAWIAVIGTVSGALAAFAFAGRYQYLMTSYEATARRLKWLSNAWHRLPDTDKSQKAGEFVRKFEDTISTENSAWVSEWMGKN